MVSFASAHAPGPMLKGSKERVKQKESARNKRGIFGIIVHVEEGLEGQYTERDKKDEKV